MREAVFISYSGSKEDAKWLKRLETHLKPLVHNNTLKLWDETRIAPGAERQKELEAALARAKVAVLLVSADYLASDLIQQQQLVPVLDAAKSEGLRILWVPVSPSLVETTALWRYQPVLDPSRPLSTYPRTQVETALVEVCRKIREAMEAEVQGEVDVPPAPAKASGVPTAPFIGVAESLGEGFKGRDAALEQLHAQLAGAGVVLTGGQTGRVFAHGGGGIGKSRLAIEYAWRFRKDYPGGVFFAVAQEQPPMALWARFARELFPAEPLARDEDAALRFALWLADPEPGRRLIIFDDVQASGVSELFERFSGRIQQGPHVLWPPPAGLVSLLVTTRLRAFPRAQSLEVSQLKDAAALDLLLERAERAGISGKEREVAQEIAATLLGGHPLALSLAGAYVSRLELTFSEYREALRQKGLTDRLVEAAKEVEYAVEDHERSIVATYELSRRQLDLSKADDALAWRLLRMCAFLAPNVPIDRKLLAHLLEPGEGGRTAEKLGRALARLLKDLSLLDPAREEHGQVGDVKIHPLVSDYTRLSMTYERERERLQADLVDAMVQLFPDDPASEPDWGWLSPSRESHATELWKAASAVETRGRWILGMQLGDLQVARGSLRRARDVYQAGLDFTQMRAQQDPGNVVWQRDVSVSLDRLGDVLVAEGALTEARNAFERSLGIREELAKKDPENAGCQRDVSVSLNKLGDVLVAEGALAEARNTFERSLGIREELAKNDPGNAVWQRDVSVSLDRLGDVLVEEGVLAEARNAFERSLGIREELAKKDSENAGWQRDVSVSLDKLGKVLLEEGALAEARNAFERSLGIREELAKKDPGHAGWQRDVSVSLERLGDVLVEEGALAEARNAFERSLGVAEELAKKDPGNAVWQRDVSVSLDRLGKVLLEEGALAEARNAFERSLGIREELAKKDPGNAGWQTDVVVSCSRVASVLRQMAPPEHSRARLLLERAKGILLSLQASSRLTPTQNRWIPAIEAQLRQLDTLQRK